MSHPEKSIEKAQPRNTNVSIAHLQKGKRRKEGGSLFHPTDFFIESQPGAGSAPVPWEVGVNETQLVATGSSVLGGWGDGGGEQRKTANYKIVDQQVGQGCRGRASGLA